MNTDTTSRFEWARSLFPHTQNVVYFNSASYGPFNTLLTGAVTDNLNLRAQADRDDSHDAFDTADELRSDYAGLIGTDRRNVGLGLNTSFGLNLAAYGLPLEPGDEVLVSDVEFPAVAYAFKAAAESRGLKLRFLKATAERFFDIEQLKRSIGERTRVLALSWVQFFNGYKNDLAELSDICRKHDLYFVVDGIQGMGAEPIDVETLGVDVFTAGCQKWMLSPQGCGFFYLSGKVREKITPPFMSWLGVDWGMNFNDLFHYDRPYFDSARKFEMGYYVVLNLMGMKASVEIFKKLGIESIQQHNYALIDRLAEYVRGSSYYEITGNMTPEHRSSIFTFTCPDVDALHRTILKNRIILVNREGSIRVSVHLFNNEEDIDRLIAVLDDFARK